MPVQSNEAMEGRSASCRRNILVPGEQVDLKTFKSGIEYLARATNQREKQPAPFLMQVGKDGLLSLVAGSEDGVLVWRTGVKVDLPRTQEGIASKLLVQATKQLKGKITIDLQPDKKALTVQTSAGGSIKLPYITEPDLPRPPKGEEWMVFNLPAGRLNEIATGVGACYSDLFNVFQVVPLTDQGTITCMFTSTDSYKKYEALLMPDHGEIEGAHIETKASFWNALRGSESNATLTFLESGVRVQSGNFEAYTANLKPHRPYRNMVSQHFPMGKKPEMVVSFDRKTLASTIKSLCTADSKTIALARTAEGPVYLTHVKTNSMAPTCRISCQQLTTAKWFWRGAPSEQPR
jgi:DNA polymerase III sliding clamp (beta) subunit (PCNA family)